MAFTIAGIKLCVNGQKVMVKQIRINGHITFNIIVTEKR